MDPQAQDASSNSIISYLRLLRQCKTTLPYGHLICVSASPNISTMAALLRLARAVGPFIAVLQVHADIIDDWSQDAARRLSCVAKKYGFLIWEGGRVLNVQKRSAKHQGMSSEEINRDINLARKRYTKGLVSVAAWAGMVSTWVIAPEEQGKGGDRLVPTLRRAAREAVAVLKKSVRTEISGGNDQRDACDNDGGYSSGGCVDDEDNGYLGSEDKLGDNLSTMFPSPRKGSVISLTRTITQHTELSTSQLFVGVAGPCSDDEEHANDGNAPTSLPPYPPPPLHSRGLVLCLPAADDPSFCHEYRRASIATAEAHSDFVVGFVSNESWIEASQINTIIGSRSNSHEGDADSEEDKHGKGSMEPPYVLFAPLESDHILFPGSESITPPAMDEVTQAHTDSVQVYVNVNGDAAGEPSQQQSSSFPLSPSTSKVQHRQINTLHQLIGRAISIRKAKASVNRQRQDCRQGDAELLCIPIISMNA
ncbi:hypothetical protein ACJ73_05506 [Blastomyces percursus]|uniref:Uncharacterized protein n=1 Tax=Blastomyces percursus TaxID=1658174 RepID=A0A1J9Q3L5_9EURO|nr:hypothetical protein ACJ73_05506 [Blastomyces percursus]